MNPNLVNFIIKSSLEIFLSIFDFFGSLGLIPLSQTITFVFENKLHFFFNFNSHFNFFFIIVPDPA